MTTIFPAGFAWGVARAAAQIEGAANEDGKGETIWDDFARRPRAVAAGEKPSVACDHYNRFESDFDLMASLGIRQYRVSSAWSRIFPNGRGVPNELGFQFYDRLIEALLERNRPVCDTLSLGHPASITGKWRLDVKALR